MTARPRPLLLPRRTKPSGETRRLSPARATAVRGADHLRGQLADLLATPRWCPAQPRPLEESRASRAVSERQPAQSASTAIPSSTSRTTRCRVTMSWADFTAPAGSVVHFDVAGCSSATGDKRLYGFALKLLASLCLIPARRPTQARGASRRCVHPRPRPRVA